MKQSVIKFVITLTFSLFIGGCASTISTKTITGAPPAIFELTIESQGSRMAGLIYTASGDGPHPTVILLHGYPGNEKNLDLAQSLRSSGWNVLFFHYRGAWGSEGEFSFLGAEQDVHTVVDFLREPSNTDKYKVDTNQIVTVGHSMGGHMAVAALLDNQHIQCAVALDGANMGVNAGQGLFNDPRIGKVWRDYSDTLFMLNGWSGAKAVAEMSAHGNKLDLIPRTAKAGQRPILLLAADTDVIPMDVHITPLFSALKQVEGSQAELIVIKDDHSFSASRHELIKMVNGFLSRQCRG